MNGYRPGNTFPAMPPYPPNHSAIPARPIVIPTRLTVIPAKAGIHTPAWHSGSGLPGFWIPAYAGMTVGDWPE